MNFINLSLLVKKELVGGAQQTKLHLQNEENL